MDIRFLYAHPVEGWCQAPTIRFRADATEYGYYKIPVGGKLPEPLNSDDCYLIEVEENPLCTDLWFTPFIDTCISFQKVKNEGN